MSWTSFRVMPKTQVRDDSAGPLLLPKDAASQLGVSTTTLAAMATRGQVECITLPSGHRRYGAASIRALLESRKSA